MWPTLVSVGPIAIQSFGLMLFLGVFFGGFVWWQKGREEGFEEEILMDHWLIAGVAAVIFGRAWYILTNWSQFAGSLYKMLFMSKFPGLSYQGALTGAGLTLLILGLKKGWDGWRMLEVGVFSFLMVEIFGWLGSLLAGNNLGQVTGWFWGLPFPGAEGRRQPVQLLWLLALWAVFSLFKKWEKEYRSFKWYQRGRDEAKPGFLVASYLIIIGLLKFGFGFLMETRTVGIGFSLSLAALGSLILVERVGLAGIKKKAAKGSAKETIKQKKGLLDQRKKMGFDFK